MSSPSGRTIHPERSKKDASLFKILAGIVIVGIVAVGVIQFSVWFQNRITSEIEAEAVDTLFEAERLILSGDADGALELLAPILDRVDNPDITPKALLLQAQIHQDAERLEETKIVLKQIIDIYSDSTEYPTAATRYARLLEEEGSMPEALALYREIRATAPSALRAPATTALARDKQRNNDLDGAQTMYIEAMDEAPWDSDAWIEASTLLGEVNTQLLFSTSPTPDSKLYTVMPGDSLTSIGSKLNITQGQLLRANGLSNPDMLRLNRTLKYTPKDFHIIIERSSCRIFVMDRKGIFKIYSAGLGGQGNDTTLGKYKIGNKEKNPVWHKPGSTPIPSGDPENELGTRWLPMVPEEEGLPRDLGIHGTIQPDSIGLYSSKGCPRMHNAEVEELYDLIVRSTLVRVVEVYTPSS